MYKHAVQIVTFITITTEIVSNYHLYCSYYFFDSHLGQDGGSSHLMECDGGLGKDPSEKQNLHASRMLSRQHNPLKGGCTAAVAVQRPSNLRSPPRDLTQLLLAVLREY